MKRILHITPHLGGGIGTVVLNWVKEVSNSKDQRHAILCLDYANEKAKRICRENGVLLFDQVDGRWEILNRFTPFVDIIVVHYWDHPMIPALIGNLQKNDAKIIFWCHKKFDIPLDYLLFPDVFVVTSPIILDHIGIDRKTVEVVDPVKKRKAWMMETIWSTGGVDDYLKIERDKTVGFNVGYIGTVDYKKVHSQFLLMIHEVGIAIPDSRFFIVGEDHISNTIQKPWTIDSNKTNFVGQIEDIKPILSQLDVFIYPLRPDHYGTCEQVLGEAMAAGVVPVTMHNPAEQTIITNGVDGFMADSVDGFAYYVEALHDNPRLRFEMAVNARKTAQEKYSLQNMINKWNELFTEVLDGL